MWGRVEWWTTDLVVLAHGHAWRVLSLARLPWHPLAGVVGRGQGSGGVGRGVLALLRRELTVGPVLLTSVAGLEGGEEETQRCEINAIPTLLTD